MLTGCRETTISQKSQRRGSSRQSADSEVKLCCFFSSVFAMMESVLVENRMENPSYSVGIVFPSICILPESTNENDSKCLRASCYGENSSFMSLHEMRGKRHTDFL